MSTAMSLLKYFHAPFQMSSAHEQSPNALNLKQVVYFFLPAECKQIRKFSPVCMKGFGSVFLKYGSGFQSGAIVVFYGVFEVKIAIRFRKIQYTLEIITYLVFGILAFRICYSKQ